MQNNDENILDEEELGKAQYEYRQKYKYKIYTNSVLTFCISFGILIAIIIGLYTFVCRPIKIVGNGMSPTLEENDIYILNKVAYKYRTPKRGDIISSNGRVYRILGLPGEKITLYGGSIYSGNYLLYEDYIKDYTYSVKDNTFFNIPLDSYFVLCDNRNCYDDSRNGIYIKSSDINGKLLTSWFNHISFNNLTNDIKSSLEFLKE